MGFLDFGKPIDINAKVAEARGVENALIIDVREPREYEYGHIEGAVNLPVGAASMIRIALKDYLIKGHESQTPLYVYCVSGARSRKAVQTLQAIGFQKVVNMGGMNRYTGKLEKGAMPPLEITETEPAPAEDSAAPPDEAAAPGLDDTDGPVTDPRVDALTAEVVAALEGGNVAVKQFQNADAAKVYLMGRIGGLKSGDKASGTKGSFDRGVMLFTEAGAEIILTEE